MAGTVSQQPHNHQRKQTGSHPSAPSTAWCRLLVTGLERSATGFTRQSPPTSLPERSTAPPVPPARPSQWHWLRPRPTRPQEDRRQSVCHHRVRRSTGPDDTQVFFSIDYDEFTRVRLGELLGLVPQWEERPRVNVVGRSRAARLDLEHWHAGILGPWFWHCDGVGGCLPALRKTWTWTWTTTTTSSRNDQCALDPSRPLPRDAYTRRSRRRHIQCPPPQGKTPALVVATRAAERQRLQP